MYTTEWVEKLYRGFQRNLTHPFEFIVYTEKLREYNEPITQRLLTNPEPRYADCIQPYELNEPMILVGLDTLVVNNIDFLANWALNEDIILLPRDPYKPSIACNGVCVVPAGNAHIWNEHNGENDMVWIRKFPHLFLDDVFPNAVVSYKGAIKGRDYTGEHSIVYFHGKPKMHQMIGKFPWIDKNWI